MKKITFIISCLASIIKKKFFKYEKNDISHDCKKAMEKVEEYKNIEEFKPTDDYVIKYRSTTRWQTL
mgnify:CR=1 FL=1